MAYFDGGFNAADHEPMQPREPLPAGKYIACIVNSEMIPTKDAQGEFLKLDFEILEGPHKGRKAATRLNLHNRSADAVRIARSELSAICRAVGVMSPNDSEELHNIPLQITIAHRKRQDTGAIAHEINGYAARPQPGPAANPAGQGQGAPPPPPGAGGPPPWRR